MGNRRRILIAYDGSPSADITLDDLRRAGLPTAVDALVLSVADVWPPSSYEAAATPRDNIPPAVKMARAQAAEAVRQAQAMTQRAAARLTRDFPQWHITTDAVADSPAWAIIQRAQDWPADLVVLGAHGHASLSRFVLGSVSQKVLTEVKCSVRIARPAPTRYPRPLRLVVAVDGSPGAAAAVTTIARRRWPTGTLVWAIAIVDPQTTIADNPFAPERHDLAQASEQEAHLWADEALDRAANELRVAGLQARTLTREGDPRHGILHEAEAVEADAIFVGASGITRRGYLVLGSVSTAVAARAQCSVEVVRTGP